MAEAKAKEEVTAFSVEKWFCDQVAKKGKKHGADVVDKGVKFGAQLAGVDGINLVEDFSLWLGSQVGIK